MVDKSSFYQFISPEEFVDYVKGRGYIAAPVINPSLEEASAEIRAYELRGPRGNRRIVIKNSQGLLPLFDAEIWCDGVDYSNAKSLAKKVSRAQKTKA